MDQVELGVEVEGAVVVVSLLAAVSLPASLLSLEVEDSVSLCFLPLPPPDLRA